MSSSRKRARLGSSVDIQYPETVLNALEKPPVFSNPALLSREDAFRNYAQYPTSRRAPAIWRAFHIIVLNSDIASFSTEEWNLPGCNIGSFRGETDEMMLEDLSDYTPGFGRYDVLDVDIGDSAGKIFRVRIIYNVGDADCNTGYWGKAFERLDSENHPCDRARPRVLAEIRSHEDSETFYEATDSARAEFSNHVALGEWVEFLGNCTTINFNCQFGFLMGLAVACSRDSYHHPPPIYLRDGLPLQRCLLQSLGRPGEDLLASKVLLEGGHIQELVARYSSEKYVSCFVGRDRSLDWYFKWMSYPLELVTALSAEDGEMTGMEDALEEICEAACEAISYGDAVLSFDFRDSFDSVKEEGVRSRLDRVVKVITLDLLDDGSSATLRDFLSPVR
eukprot:CAMPEP_0194305480 /NCGR_PEP_ID=MMETSP0171-20130528/2909_1 /TAXON_ID=218684 /ORGANISM="Corethron pennatum, Strain L29A3" /LENGTH=391 /DNA_ID=CAMNT_0039057025 /DNA_START=60 /DNA_END=1235 /DNA_ORIENTATION=-